MSDTSITMNYHYKVHVQYITKMSDTSITMNYHYKVHVQYITKMSDTSITMNYHYISPTILYGSDFEMPRPFHKSNPVRVYTLLILIVIACQHKKLLDYIYFPWELVNRTPSTCTATIGLDQIILSLRKPFLSFYIYLLLIRLLCLFLFFYAA